MKLVNKRIVITGGTSGIGYQLVKSLHSANEVVVIARNPHKLNKLAHDFEGVITYQTDLSKLEEVELVTDAIIKRFDTIDLLINNAAIQSVASFLDDDFIYRNICTEITLNFTSVCCMTYRLLPALLHQNRSTIFNINSGLALAPKTSSAVYCGTKSALNLFSQSLRYQLEKTNIRVQQVFLPLVDTQMTKGRGKNKMTSSNAARIIIKGIERGVSEHYIGKANLLRILLRLTPWLAKKILKKY